MQTLQQKKLQDGEEQSGGMESGRIETLALQQKVKT